MMVAERATAPGQTAPCSDQNNHAKSTTPEPPVCGLCQTLKDLYVVTDGALCLACLGAAVSLAANDVFSDMVHYSREFEKVLIYG